MFNDPIYRAAWADVRAAGWRAFLLDALALVATLVAALGFTVLVGTLVA